MASVLLKNSLSYTITGGAARHEKSEAENMADFDVNWRHNHDNWFLMLMVITTDLAHFRARHSFHTPLVLAKRFIDF